MGRRARQGRRSAASALVLGLALGLALGAAGCGGIDPTRSPAEATGPEFCKAYQRVANAEPTTSASDMEDYLYELARFGTPPGIPTAARAGFEYIIDTDHPFANGAQFTALRAGTDVIGQNAAALHQYADQIC